MNLLFRIAAAVIGLSLALGASAMAQSGCSGGRYLQPVFSCVQVTPSIQYGVGRHDWRSELLCSGSTNGVLPPYNSLLPLFADVYAPCQDPDSVRAFILYIHGGAFAAGDKAAAQDAAICDSLARRGYVVASINYRLSLCGANALTLADQINRNPYELRRAAHRALQDAKAAVRFFKAYADSFGIDTTRFFAAGVSAGAITALGLAYLDQPYERYPEAQALPGLGSWLGSLLYPDLGPIEGEGGNPGFSSRIRGVAPVAGSVMDLSILESALDPPALLVHGTADLTVPYDTGCFFQDLISQGIVSRCHLSYGSQAISRVADSLGLCHRFLSFANAGHALSAVQVDTVIDEVARFFHGLSCGGPQVAASALQVERCIGAPAQLSVTPAGPGWRYFWFKGDSLLAGQRQPELSFASVSPTDYGGYLCLVEDSGCHRAWSDTLQLAAATPTPAVIAVAGDTAFCRGDTLMLFGNSGAGMSFQWLRNGLQLRGDTLRSIPVIQGGGYALALTDSNGCHSLSDTLQVTEYSLPQRPAIRFAGLPQFCEGDSLLLTAQGRGDFFWSTGERTPSLWVSQPGTFWVALVDSNHCRAFSDTLDITEQRLPWAGFTFTVAGDTVFFDNRSQNGATFSWTFGDGQTDTARNPVHLYSGPGSYVVHLSVANACGRDSMSLPLTLLSTGLQALPGALSLSYYPNPSTGHLWIHWPDPGRSQFIEIKDLQGRSCIKYLLRPGLNEVDLKTLSPGIYVLQTSEYRPGKLLVR